MASVRKRRWVVKGEDGEEDAERVAWVADYFDQAGKRHIKTCRTKKEADAFLVAARHEVSQGVHTAASASITVSAAGKLWIDQGVTDGLEPSTILQYQQHLGLHIVPFIGSTKLSDLTRAAAEQFRNRLIKEGRSRAMTKKVMTSLGSLLAVAQSHGKVVRNVVRERSRKPEKRGRRHQKRLEVGVDIPTKDEIRTLLSSAAGRWRPLVITATFTGLRASELRGLRWKDVDLARKTIRVSQRADRWNTIGSPKSEAGTREVPLAPMVANALKAWRKDCPKREVGDAQVLDLVFPNGDGNVENLTNIHRRGIGALQVECGIAEAVVDAAGKPMVDDDGEPVLRQKYGLHALRHAAASLFIEQGFTPKRIQALMGHSSIQVTFDIYGHLFPMPEDDLKAMEQMQARLVG